MVLSFRPDYLGLYLENLSNIHNLSDIEFRTLVDLSDSSNTADNDSELTIEQEQFTITHTRYRRDPGFKNLVHEAYGHRWAMCGIQLELV